MPGAARSAPQRVSEVRLELVSLVVLHLAVRAEVALLPDVVVKVPTLLVKPTHPLQKETTKELGLGLAVLDHARAAGLLDHTDTQKRY